MKLEKKYEVITNKGQRLYVIGKGSDELEAYANKVIGLRRFYALDPDMSFVDEFYGNLEDTIYALTPEDFHKFNSYKEPIDPWVYDRLPTKEDGDCTGNVYVYGSSPHRDFRYLHYKSVAFFELPWVSEKRLDELNLKELPKPKQKKINH